MDSSNSCSLSENVSSSEQQRATMIDNLESGQEFTIQLRKILAGIGVNSESSAMLTARDLVSKIMSSFTNTLFMLDQNDVAVNVKSENDVVVSSVEVSEESICRSASSPARTPKDRRGSYKRRKSFHTRIKETSTEINDGHAWRKYGQKKILNTKYPRNYFRCTHKFDQHCQATKDVQKIQDEPPLFRTTYYGQHTCRTLTNAPELILDCPSPTHNSKVLLINFNTGLKNISTKQPIFATSTPFENDAEVKQEFLKSDMLASADHMIPYCDHNIVSAGQDESNPSLAGYLDLSRAHDDCDLVVGYDHSDLASNFESTEIDMEPFDDEVLQHFNF